MRNWGNFVPLQHSRLEHLLRTPKMRVNRRVFVPADTLHFFGPFFHFTPIRRNRFGESPLSLSVLGGLKCIIYCIDNICPKFGGWGQKKPTWLGWADNQSRGIVENEKACPPAPFPWMSNVLAFVSLPFMKPSNLKEI